MNNRDESRFGEDWRPAFSPDVPHSIGDVLEELLAQYQVRFPELQLTVVETSEVLV